MKLLALLYFINGDHNKYMNKIYIETLGCNKNQVDTEVMMSVLEKIGYEICDNNINADIIIINTCCFIQSAKEEAIETILEYIELKKSSKIKKIIVAGCMAQYYADILKKEIPEIDIIFGIGDIKKIAEVINSKDKVMLPDFIRMDYSDRKILGYPGSAYIKISDGCSNYCSYCIIPMIRGNLRSKKIEVILEEVNSLINNGINEIILIAQDTANYGIDIYNKQKLDDLVKKIDERLDGNKWLRILYMHPDHITDDILRSLKGLKSFIPYFDIPFQSGSNKILKLMGREGTREKYIDLIEKIRSTFNDSIIRSTFITGFPQESPEDFNDTLNFIEKIQIDWIGGFEYSKEKGTKAYDLKNHINPKTKNKRLSLLYKHVSEITKSRLKRFIGTTQKILIEERVENEELYIGRFWGQAPEIDGLTVINGSNIKPGDFINAKIIKLNDMDFLANA